MYLFRRTPSISVMVLIIALQLLRKNIEISVKFTSTKHFQITEKLPVPEFFAIGQNCPEAIFIQRNVPLMVILLGPVNVSMYPIKSM